MTLSSGEAIFRFLIDADKNEEKKQIITNGLLIFGIGNAVTIAIAMTYFIQSSKNYSNTILLFLVL